jgi:hypothetical protein
MRRARDRKTRDQRPKHPRWRFGQKRANGDNSCDNSWPGDDVDDRREQALAAVRRDRDRARAHGCAQGRPGERAADGGAELETSDW